MGKKRRIQLAALAFAMLGGLVWLVMPSSEPVYNGKPVSYYIRNQPFTIPRMDSNAVPYLVKGVETRDGAPSRAYSTLWNKLPLSLRSLFPAPVPAERVRFRAIAALSQMGGDAEPAIPALVHALRTDENDTVRALAATTLGNVGKNDKMATDALVDAFKGDKSSAVRPYAGRALQHIDPEAAAKAGVE